MARPVFIVALIFPLCGLSLLCAQEPPPPPPPTAPSAPVPPDASKDDWRWKKDWSRNKNAPPVPPLDEEDKGPLMRFKKRLDQMSPEDQQHFQENWKRWREMNAGEQKDWQSRAKEERDRMKRVIDEAIQKTGLQLSDDQREVFVLRYRQERRKIEEQLRKEMDAKRQSEIDDMLQRLKAEFSTPKPVSPAPSPAAAEKKP